MLCVASLRREECGDLCECESSMTYPPVSYCPPFRGLSHGANGIIISSPSLSLALAGNTIMQCHHAPGRAIIMPVMIMMMVTVLTQLPLLSVCSIRTINVHPSYFNNGSAIVNDIAVLTLSGDVPFYLFLTPILLNGDKSEAAGRVEAPGELEP